MGNVAVEMEQKVSAITEGVLQPRDSVRQPRCILMFFCLDVIVGLRVPVRLRGGDRLVTLGVCVMYFCC